MPRFGRPCWTGELLIDVENTKKKYYQVTVRVADQRCGSEWECVNVCTYAFPILVCMSQRRYSRLCSPREKGIILEWIQNTYLNYF
jgi:hypothetical protein